MSFSSSPVSRRRRFVTWLLVGGLCVLAGLSIRSQWKESGEDIASKHDLPIWFDKYWNGGRGGLARSTTNPGPVALAPAHAPFIAPAQTEAKLTERRVPDTQNMVTLMCQKEKPGQIFEIIVEGPIKMKESLACDGEAGREPPAPVRLIVGANAETKGLFLFCRNGESKSLRFPGR